MDLNDTITEDRTQSKENPLQFPCDLGNNFGETLFSIGNLLCKTYGLGGGIAFSDCIIMSHSLLWRHIVLLTVGVYSSNHRVLYTIEISMTRRVKKVQVRPSVCPFVTLTKKAYSFIIDSRRIICISGERVQPPLQENEAIFSKNIFQKFQSEISKNFALV